MKTLINLTATVSDSVVATPVIAGKSVAASSPAIIPSGGIVNTQAQQGFWRRVRHAKGGSYFESSTGASVFVPLAETFKLIEANEPLFVAPTAAPKT
jgi:hypothetical protein